jgi:hypothetical protein
VGTQGPGKQCRDMHGQMHADSHGVSPMLPPMLGTCIAHAHWNGSAGAVIVLPQQSLTCLAAWTAPQRRQVQNLKTLVITTTTRTLQTDSGHIQVKLRWCSCKGLVCARTTQLRWARAHDGCLMSASKTIGFCLESTLSLPHHFPVLTLIATPCTLSGAAAERT